MFEDESILRNCFSPGARVQTSTGLEGIVTEQGTPNSKVLLTSDSDLIRVKTVCNHHLKPVRRGCKERCRTSWENDRTDQGQENQSRTQSHALARQIWTRPADLHTGQRRVKGRTIRPDTSTHSISISEQGKSTCKTGGIHTRSWRRRRLGAIPPSRAGR